MRPEAVEAMLPFLTERFGNPSGSHRFARDARKAIDEARDVRSPSALGVRPGEVVFTGGGTEADNPAVLGAVAAAAACRLPGGRAPRRAPPRRAPRRHGRRRRSTPGTSTSTRSAAALDDPTSRVVSVMVVNNEVGTITDSPPCRELVRSRAPRRACCTPTRCRRAQLARPARRSRRTSTCCRSAPTSSAARRASACSSSATGVDARRR